MKNPIKLEFLVFPDEDITANDIESIITEAIEQKKYRVSPIYKKELNVMESEAKMKEIFRSSPSQLLGFLDSKYQINLQNKIVLDMDYGIICITNENNDELQFDIQDHIEYAVSRFSNEFFADYPYDDKFVSEIYLKTLVGSFPKQSYITDIYIIQDGQKYRYNKNGMEEIEIDNNDYEKDDI